MASNRRPFTRTRLQQLGILQAERIRAEKLVRQNIASVRALLLIDSEDVEDGFEKLEICFRQYLTAHSKCQMLLEDDEPTFIKTLEELDRSVHLLKREILERTSNSQREQIQQARSKKLTINRYDDMSERTRRKPEPSEASGKSSTSEIRQARLLEVARLKQLMLEQEFIAKRKKAQLDAELMENELQIAIAQSKLEVFGDSADPLSSIPVDNSYVAEYVSKHSLKPPSQCASNPSNQAPHPPCTPKPSRPSSFRSVHLPKLKSKQQLPFNNLPRPFSSTKIGPFGPEIPPEQTPKPQSEQAEASSISLLSEMIGYLQAPEAEIDVFHGNPLNYDYFIATFHEAVERKIKDSRSRLTRLLQYVKGEPKDLIKGCIHMPPNEGYPYAKQLLKKRYGDPFRVYSEYMKELQNWPKIKPNDGQAFRRFHSFLVKYKSNINCYRSSITNSPELLQTLAKKLPQYLQNRWAKLVLKVRKYDQDVTIAHFIHLIEEESTVVNDPLFSHQALSEGKSLENKRSSSSSSFKVHANQIPQSSSSTCVSCKQVHDLEDCPDYKKLSVKDRHAFLFRNRLCYCCYKPTSSTHSARTCNRKRKCSICKELHPSGLHGYYVKPNVGDSDQTKSVKAGCVKANSTVNVSSSVGLCVVPVKLFCTKSPNAYVETYALLDNGSQGTFIDIDVLQNVGAEGFSTSLSIKTIHGERTERSTAVEGLVVASLFDESYQISLPRTYSQTDLPVDEEDIPTNERLSQWTYLKPICKYLPSSSKDVKVGLLIGSNCPKALEPLKVIPSQNEGPFAYQTRLGWCVSGPIDTVMQSKTQSCKINRTGRPTDTTLCCFRMQTHVKEIDLKEMMLSMYQHEFNEAPSCPVSTTSSQESSYSQEDKRFMKMMNDQCKFVDGKYILPLPFRNQDTQIPNNRSQAVQRANYLKRKLQKNEKIFKDYTSFMSTIIDKGYAVKCQADPIEGKTWYIPHHGVYHPRKPEKIRVVFDCSAQYQNLSLNSMLLQGPDLTNQLVGVLSRFREEPIGFFGDIEKMFYQVKVPEEQQDYLRFLWWQDGKLDTNLVEYRMTVHLFGAISSPSCANFALRKTAEDNAAKYDQEVSTILKENFYVDDLLKSTSDEKKAQNLMWETKRMCKDGGFNLVQLGSTSRELIETIPEDERMKGIKNIDLSSSPLPVERVLGVSWCIQNDEFNFRIVLQDKPLTRRGILSSVSSIYDPLGFACPVMLLAKRLLQKLIKDKKDWDEVISDEDRAVWERWRADLPNLEQVSIQRCFKPSNFGAVTKAVLHHFSDASTIGYGQCSYLQLTNDEDQITSSFVMGKSRVAPLKYTTVPRLELTAAVTSTKVANLLQRELKYVTLEHVFWTDSKVVLGYINNEDKSFHIFVANRIEIIRSNTDVTQWNYIPSKSNPGDIATRGISASKLASDNLWLQGPDLLRKPFQQTEQPEFDVQPDDPEVKTKRKVLFVKEQSSFIDRLLSRTNSWWKLRRIVAWMLKWRYQIVKNISLDDIEDAERRIIKLVQKDVFSKDINNLRDKSKDACSTQLSSLNPFLDEKGILRVGGRLQKSHLNVDCMNPIILPKKHMLSRMILTWYHTQAAHSGRGITMNALRTAGYWIINLNSMTRSVIRNCFKCRYERGNLANQQMADLPADRTETVPPFTYVGVDMFGPFQVRERRSTIKKFVALFTCMNSRAIHLESSSHLDTDSFIMMLRRFIARRGQIRLLRSDNGTNFVGCDNELKKALEEMDDDKLDAFLQQRGGEWMGWKRNPPASSHMGGAWERLIRSARSIFSVLLQNHGLSLNNEAFLTLLAEVEAIINSRPLTSETLNDGASDLPLSPMNLLTMKSKVVLPPPGNFQKNDLYCRKQWRRVQHVANEFWRRWQKEYLQILQQRTKWKRERRNFSQNDVVLLKESSHRNDWRLARIVSVDTSDDGLIRSCKLKTRDGIFSRPIHKLVLLIEAEGDGFR